MSPLISRRDHSSPSPALSMLTPPLTSLVWGRVRAHHPAWVMLDDQRLREPELTNWPPMKDFPEFNERARPPGESSPKLKKRP